MQHPHTPSPTGDEEGRDHARKDSITRQPREGKSVPFRFDDVNADDSPPIPGTLRAHQHRPEFDARPDTEIDRTDFAHALNAFVSWIMPPRGFTHTGYAQRAGLRAVAAAWVLRPDRFEGMSLHAVSKRIGCSDSILSRYAGQFSDRFGIRSTAQLSPREIAARKVARSMPAQPADPSVN